jgi:YjbE family integral membrane protein
MAALSRAQASRVYSCRATATRTRELKLELFSPEFFSALLAIILIDVVLAGDNAIVIALASRNLPDHLRKRAVMWGAVGAVGIRSVMTLGVVWLLQIPGLLAAGGLALLWIAYKLLVDESHTNEKSITGATNFFGAMKTIIIADAVMGIDNVLAVAGAAHGSYLLVVLGLLISIPIVVWGSTILLHFTERFPAIIYIGGAVLAGTGVKMVLSESAVAAALPQNMVLITLIYIVVVAGILMLGLYRNQVRRMRSAVRLHAAARRKFRSGSLAAEAATEKILLPIDGSRNSLAAVHRVVEEYGRNPALEILLLNVQPRFNRYIAQFFTRKDLDSYRAEQSERASQSARKLLDRLDVPYRTFMEVGPRAETIAAFAKRHGCNRIVVGTARRNSLTRLFESSVTARLLEKAAVPVELVLGTEASRWERFGVPAGVGAALATVFVAAD